MGARSSPRERARELIAEAFEAQGTNFHNVAGLIRTGFENFWIKPALDALAPLVALLPDEDPD